jgi:hypothetical protein
MTQPIEITPALLAELKSKANAAYGEIWYENVDFGCVSAREDDTRSYHVLSDEDALPEHKSHIAAANPAVVLAMVEEIERLREFAKNIAKAAFQLNLYHECCDPDDCRTCHQLQVARELVENYQKGGAE